MDFESFFSLATGNKPFPYQKRLATARTLPQLLDIPTGAGKTASVVLGWLWRRRFASSDIQSDTPRRLVYCLPMRVLVEQTAEECLKWLSNLGLSGNDPGKILVQVLMGGDFDNDWDLHPERDTILIGTQDMLMSRALNRGYAVSRYRWPSQFAFLHSDCLWVYDETQLFGVGLKTAAQLESFRRSMRTMRPSNSLWMSATLTEGALNTVDAREWIPAPLPRIGLDDDDRTTPQLAVRLRALKTIIKSALVLDKDSKKSYEDSLAELILERHLSRGGQTLAVLNTVGRAQGTFKRLLAKLPGKGEVPTLLVHSRFRPHERAELSARLMGHPPEAGRIVIATQAVEAGVDITSRTLVTEIAPWSSLVQRFGRCNRYGEEEDGGAEIYWVDIQTEQDFPPYTAEQLDKARGLLSPLSDAGPESVKGRTDGLPEPAAHVIRRKDLVELFDTTPDLAGADIDISRFIRDESNLDIQVYWRNFDSKPGVDMAQPRREELCSVRVGAFRDFFLKRTKDHSGSNAPFWVWDSFDGDWTPLAAPRIRPGLVVLANARTGGYHSQFGWYPGESGPVAPVPSETADPGEANTDDPETCIGRFIPLSEHSDHVVAEMNLLLDALGMDGEEAEALRIAARHHDWGKAHAVFQGLLTERAETDSPVPEGGPWAKSDKMMRRSKKHPRPQFRHELASALAALQDKQPDLSCYLIAAHHGKVRLSIRSMPEEKVPPEPERRFARGIWDRETLPPCDLGGENNRKGEIVLDLEPMELGNGMDGSPSWMARSLTLRDKYGPFRLAYLEALLRAADCRASMGERLEGGSS